ncbi:MAG: CopG family transcriptional regulator [Acidimicrobiia bacterium]
MHRTTVYLPEDLKAGIEREARREGVTEAEVIRRAVGEHLDEVGSPRPNLPLFPDGFGVDIVSIVDEGPLDL